MSHGSERGAASAGGQAGPVRGRALVPLTVVAAVVAISTAAPVIRLAAPLEAEVVACLRVSVTVLALLTVSALRSGRAWIASLRTLAAAPYEAGLTVLAGLCLAAHFGAWIASLSFTSVVRSVALVSTTPLFAGLLARILGDRATPRLYLGSLVAIVGTTIMVEVDGPGPGGETGQWIGDLLALSGAVTAALYLALGRVVQTRLGDALPVEDYFVNVNLVACVALWGLVFARGAELAPAQVEAGDYLALLWLGLVPGLVGHGLLNWAVRRVPVHVVSLAVLLEPVGAAVFAWILLAEVPGLRELLGALTLLGGVALGLPRKTRAADG